MGREGSAGPECDPGAPGWDVPARPRVWRTDEVAEGERFAYYREAICEAFMELAPERAAGESGFSATVESLPLPGAAVNRVRATPHRVTRTRHEIARSPRQCYYLNLQYGGECRIGQGGRTVPLRPGQVAIFDSARPFELEHPWAEDLRVASFWVPHEALDSLAGPGARFDGRLVSAHPRLGPVIATTARTLVEKAGRLSVAEAAALFDGLLRLTALAAEDGDVTSRGQDLPRAALLNAILDHLESRLDDPGLSVKAVAAAFGVTPRWVHRLFEPTGRSFGATLLDLRLDRAAEALTAAGDPRPISTIAYGCGFNDLSHFNRRFRARFGMTPREMRSAAR